MTSPVVLKDYGNKEVFTNYETLDAVSFSKAQTWHLCEVGLC